MEKKTVNVSSGASKVESLEKENAATAANGGKTAKAAPKKSGVKSVKTQVKTEKTVKSPKTKKTAAEKKEEKAAEKRLAAAKTKAEKKEKKLLHKAELKQKKMEKKMAVKEKKLAKKEAVAKKKAERKQARLDHAAALKEKKVEKKAERIARREMLKNESKADRRARIEREKKEKIALKRQKALAREKEREQRMKAREAAHERRAQERRHKREQKTERRKHAPGFGGWLAAVISLGVACLALGAVVTAGAFRMNDMTLETANGYRSTLYELVAASEDMDSNLSKLRVSSGANEQRTLLTDILVDSELMESALERMPIDSVTSTDISSFVNKTGSYCRDLLGKINRGQPLTQTEKNTVEYLYNINAGLYSELNDMTTHMTEKDFMAFIGGGEGVVSEKFGEVGQSTLQEPEETIDAPFSGEGNVGTNRLAEEEKISESRAEELVKEYLQGYHIANTQYTGETIAHEVTCYNFTLTDESGNEIFAQITENGGKLAFFDTYEECTEKNFDLDTCDSLAREFLSGLGIEDVAAVWLSDGGMVADITYVGIKDGVRVYPDLIRVRVCESKGRVVGMDAMGYLLNHDPARSIGTAMSRESAQAKLSSGLKPYSAHLAVIPLNGEEVLAHEFACTYGEEEYVVYLDAVTGEELQVYRVRSSARGSFLR